MYVDTDVDVTSHYHSDAPDVDVRAKLKVTTHGTYGFEYDVDEVFYCTYPCDTCGSLLLVDEENEICEVCAAGNDNDSNDSIDPDDYD